MQKEVTKSWTSIHALQKETIIICSQECWCVIILSYSRVKSISSPYKHRTNREQLKKLKNIVSSCAVLIHAYVKNCGCIWRRVAICFDILQTFYGWPSYEESIKLRNDFIALLLEMWVKRIAKLTTAISEATGMNSLELEFFPTPAMWTLLRHRKHEDFDASIQRNAIYVFTISSRERLISKNGIIDSYTKWG